MGTAREGLRSAGLLAVALFAAGCATHARPSLRHAPRDPAAVAAAVSVGDLRGVSCALEGDTGRLRDTVQGMDALDGVRRSEEIWAQVELSCGDGRDIDREVARRIAELER